MKVKGWLCVGFLVPCVAWSTNIKSHTYFIRNDGSDKNTGLTPQRAWKSIAHLESRRFQPGDVVILEGTFVGAIRLSNVSSLRIEGAGDQPATILSGNQAALTITDSSDITVRNLRLVGSGPKLSVASGLVIRATRPATQFHDITVENVEASQYGHYGVHLTSELDDSGYRNVKFSHVNVHHNVLGGLVVDSVYPSVPHKNVTVEYVEASFNHGDPTLRYHSGSGILLSGIDTARIEYSEAFENGALSRPIDTGGPVGIWAWNGRDVVMQFNKSHHNHCGCGADGGGFDLDGGITDSVIQYNFSAFNDGYGYQLAQFPHAPEFARNRLVNNISYADTARMDAGGINLWGPVGGDSIIEKNIIYSKNSNDPRSSQLYFHQWTGDKLRITKNIYFNKQANPVIVMRDSEGAGLHMDRNGFFAATSLSRVLWLEKIYQSLSDWRNNTGFEMNSSMKENVNLDATLLNLMHKEKLEVDDFTKAHQIFVK